MKSREGTPKRSLKAREGSPSEKRKSMRSRTATPTQDLEQKSNLAPEDAITDVSRKSSRSEKMEVDQCKNLFNPKALSFF